MTETLFNNFYTYSEFYCIMCWRLSVQKCWQFSAKSPLFNKIFYSFFTELNMAVTAFAVSDIYSYFQYQNACFCKKIGNTEHLTALIYYFCENCKTAAFCVTGSNWSSDSITSLLGFIQFINQLTFTTFSSPTKQFLAAKSRWM